VEGDAQGRVDRQMVLALDDAPADFGVDDRFFQRACSRMRACSRSRAYCRR
jgi:hypothetical protein